MKALLLTHHRDTYTIDRVAAEVARRGVEPVRVDTDTFPARLGLDALFGPDGAAATLTVGDRTIAADEVVGVWCRRLWGAPPSPEMDRQMAIACARESAAARDVWLAALEGRAVAWVNRPDREHAAENKGRQLAAARAEGLAIPDTLVTNQPDAARAFWHRHDGRVVTKMLTPFEMSLDGDRPFVYTSAVSAADLEALDGLRHCPMVFQARVPKSHELRVVVVGDRAFAGAIDARGTDGAVDWRRSAPGDACWRPADLDPVLARRLCATVRRLGLVYGAADVIVRPDGTPVFLEVNPAGEWGMIEHQLEQPIAAALADHLVRSPEAAR